jgi:hypothetical protein
MMKYFLLIVTFLLPISVATKLTIPVAAKPSTSVAAKVSNTNELIAAMQKKYGKSWYKTATFVQETINFQPDGTSKVETWYEAMSVPGSLRIDFTPTSAGNGILFTGGKLLFQRRQTRQFAPGQSSASNSGIRHLSLSRQRDRRTTAGAEV